MKVLITGGAGFVGRHFVHALQKTCEQIILVDNFFPGGGSLKIKDWFFKPNQKVKIINEDCRFFFQNNNSYFDLVIHLAAVIGGRRTIESNPLAVADDLSIDAGFWSWAIKTKPGHIISFSSSAAYPVALQGKSPKLLSEADISFEKNLGVPDLTYGWSKLTNEYLGIIAHKMYGLKVACYRPFSGYGPDQDISYPFPAICLRAIEHIESENFEVWGTGQQVRDFIHIQDLVDGVLQTYNQLNNGSAVNICTGHGITFIALAQKVLQTLGKNSNISGNTDEPQGVFSRIGDPREINSLGWSPKVTLEEGIVECLLYLSDLEGERN